MVTRLLRLGILVALLLLPSMLYSAESVKLRHVLSIYMDSKEGILNVPQGVAVRGNTVIVADSGNGRLLKYSYQDGSLKGGEEFRVTEVAYPQTLQIGTGGDIYVLDGRQRKIAHIGPDGVFRGFVKAEGAPGPDFVPMSFRLDRSDNLYVLDVFSARVILLDRSGKYLRSVNFPDNYGFISDIEVDAKGSIFLLDSVKAMVYVLAKDAREFVPLTGSLKREMNFAVNLGADSKGFLYLADQNGGGLVGIAPDGSFQGRQAGYGWKEGLLRYPCQLFFDDKDNLFIADRENGRVQIFSPVK